MAIFIVLKSFNKGSLLGSQNSADNSVFNGSRSEKTLQKFSSVHSTLQNQFNFERHITKRDHFKSLRNAALNEWRQLSAA